jgi:hypothetical protein
MAQSTRDFLTSGPAVSAGGDGGDLGIGTAYQMAWRQITDAIVDADSKKSDSSKKIIDELKALREQLKADTEKNTGKTLGQLPPDIAKEFLDVTKVIKQIIGGGTSTGGAGVSSDSALVTRGDLKQLVNSIRQGTAGIRDQAISGGGPIGTAAMAGADALIPGMGIVVKALQENSAVIKETYHAFASVGTSIKDTLTKTHKTQKNIEDSLNPSHPRSIHNAIGNLGGGGFGGLLGAGALGAGAFALFAPDELKKKVTDALTNVLKEGLKGLNDKLGEMAKQGQDEFKQKLKTLLMGGAENEKLVQAPAAPYADADIAHPSKWITINPAVSGLLDPSIERPGGKITDFNKRLDEAHPRMKPSTQPSTQLPADTPKELNERKSRWRDRRKGVRKPRSGGSSVLPSVTTPSPDTAPSPKNSFLSPELMPSPSLGLDRLGLGYLGNPADTDTVESPPPSGLGLGYLGGSTGTISDDLYHPSSYTGTSASVTRSIYADGFNTGTAAGDKGDVVVQLMKKQTDLLGGILAALTGGGGTRSLGGGGIQLASLGELGGVSGGLGGGLGTIPGFPGSGFGAGFPGSGGVGGGGGRGRSGGGGGGGGGGYQPSTAPDTTTPSGPTHQTLLPPGTTPIGPSTSAFTPIPGDSFSNLRTVKTIPNPQAASGGGLRPDLDLFAPPTRTQGPFDTSKASVLATRPNTSPNVDPGLFAPPTNIGGTPGGLNTRSIPPGSVDVGPGPSSAVGTGVGPQTTRDQIYKPINIPPVSGMTAAERYHNPGAAYPIQSNALFGGQGQGIIGGGHKIEAFPNDVQGLAANMYEFTHGERYGGGDKTLGEALHTWRGREAPIPPGFNYNEPASKIINDKERMAALFAGVMKNEGRKGGQMSMADIRMSYDISKAGGIDAYAKQGGGRPAAVATQSSITLPSAGDTQGTKAANSGGNTAPDNILAEARKVALLGGAPAVKAYMARSGYPAHDNWCGDFASTVIKNSGGTPPKNPAVASNWRNWGTADPTPHPGDIAIADRGVRTGDTGSHVTTVESVNAKTGKFSSIGGNQGTLRRDFPIGGYTFRRAIVTEDSPGYESRVAGPGVPTGTASATPIQRPIGDILKDVSGGGTGFTSSDVTRSLTPTAEHERRSSLTTDIGVRPDTPSHHQPGWLVSQTRAAGKGGGMIDDFSTGHRAAGKGMGGIAEPGPGGPRLTKDEQAFTRPFTPSVSHHQPGWLVRQPPQAPGKGAEGPIHREESTPVSHEDIGESPHNVNQPETSGVSMPRQRPTNLGVKGGGPKSSELHHGIEVLKDQHSRMQRAHRKPATQHHRGHQEGRHAGTPQVSHMNSDVAVHIDSSTHYLS